MNASGWDEIVVGAGHNGLVAAAYLARAGHRVLVLEARDRVGGACTTEETWPGFKVSTAAYVVSLLRPELVRELELERHGYEVLPRQPSSFTPFPDGRFLLMGADPGLNRRELAKFSVRDAERFPAYEAMLERVARALEPMLAEPAADPFAGGGRNLWSLARDAWRLRRLGPHDGPAAVELLAAPARSILDRWFESDEVKATLATDAIIGAMASPATPGTAYVLFHHVMGEAGGARGVWGYVRGGMGALSDALAGAAREAGAQLRTSAKVARILVADGRAQGVVLADGTELRARRVVSNADANVTLLELAGAEHLAAEIADRVRAIDYASASLKINVALSELPDFPALPGTAPGPQHRGTIHVAPSLAYLEAAFDDARRGEPSRAPILECTIPSVVDPTVAPPGKHVMSMFVQYAPYRLAGGRTSAHPEPVEGRAEAQRSWDDEKERFADRCFDALEAYAPNFRRAVIAREVLSPLDLERRFALTGGNIFQGAMTANQLLFMRPIPGFARYRTPIRDLWMCGAATHPGGGVMGTCGWLAAREILRERR